MRLMLVFYENEYTSLSEFLLEVWMQSTKILEKYAHAMDL